MSPTDLYRSSPTQTGDGCELSDERTEFELERTDLELNQSIEEIHRVFKEDYQELIRYARKRARSSEAAQDVVQQAFANTLTAIERGARIRNMAAFLQRCVRNICVNNARRDPPESIDEELNRLTEKSIEASVELREEWREVATAVDELGSNQRCAFVLAELKGLECREIADRMNCSTETVWQLLSRARKQIRKSTGPRSLSLTVPALLMLYAENQDRTPFLQRIQSLYDQTLTSITNLQLSVGWTSQSWGGLVSQPTTALAVAALAVVTISAGTAKKDRSDRPGGSGTSVAAVAPTAQQSASSRERGERGERGRSSAQAGAHPPGKSPATASEDADGNVPRPSETEPRGDSQPKGTEQPDYDKGAARTSNSYKDGDQSETEASGSPPSPPDESVSPWVDPVSLSFDGQGEGSRNVSNPEVVVDQEGNALVVWQRGYGGMTSNIRVATRLAGGSWSESVDIFQAAHGFSSRDPKIAVDREGNAVAVWNHYYQENEEWYYTIKVATHSAGSTESAWSTPVDLFKPASGRDSWEPQLAVNPRGDAVVAWQRLDGTTFGVQASTRPAGGSWSTPVDLNKAVPGRSASNVRVAIDPNGNADVLWHSEGPNYSVQAVAYSAGGSWSTAVNLSKAGENAAAPQVAADSDGNAVAVWLSSGAANSTIVRAATRQAGGAWGDPVDISAADRQARFPKIVVNQRGDAVVAWLRYNGESGSTIRAATRPAGGSWDPVVADLSIVGQRVNSPHLAIDEDGNAVAVWANSKDGGPTNGIQSVTYRFGGSWGAPIDLFEAVPGQNARYPRVDFGPPGGAVAVWQHYSSEGYFVIRAATYGALSRNPNIPNTRSLLNRN